MCAGGIEIVEDSVESHHAALTQFLVVLDMEHGETSRILLEVLHRTYVSNHCPVDIHLEEHLCGVCVAEHIVVPHLILHLFKLVRVAVVAELHACLVHHFANGIHIVAYDLCLCECLWSVHVGHYNILHAGFIVCIDTLFPPFQGVVEFA